MGVVGGVLGVVFLEVVFSEVDVEGVVAVELEVVGLVFSVEL